MSSRTLYAVHIEGPDDLIAAVDLAEAEARAAEINGIAEELADLSNASPADPVIRAVVIEWPYSFAEHAEEIARGDERWGP